MIALKSSVRFTLSLQTNDWPIPEHIQDDGYQAPELTLGFSEHVDVVSRVAGQIGAQTLAALLRGSAGTASFASDGISTASQLASSLCLESGRTKAALAFRAVDYCTRTVGSTWAYASSFGALCIENTAQPIITYSTRKLLDGAAVTADGAGRAWEAVSGIARRFTLDAVVGSSNDTPAAIELSTLKETPE